MKCVHETRASMCIWIITLYVWGHVDDLGVDVASVDNGVDVCEGNQ